MILDALALVGACVADRYILRRRNIKDISLGTELSSDGEFYRFPLRFKVTGWLHHTVVTYELRDAKRPTTVIAGKERRLDFAKKGENEEFLLIRRGLVQEGGTWILNAEIRTVGCWLNPIYKLFPIIIKASQDFNITLPKKGND